MIPPTSFQLSDDGTEAWVVAPSPVDAQVAFNRPCDTCGGNQRIDLPDYANARCPDCDGTGRHTFTVEVEQMYCDGGCGWVSRLKPGRCGQCDGGLVDNRARTHRVHVLDVLPIYGPPDTPLTAGVNRWVWHSPDDLDEDRRGTWVCWIDGNETQRTPITLPPDAAPGRWAVKLAVHS